MKAIIPVAGAGLRLRPHTYTQPKPLMPVAGKPILAFIVDKLIASGLTEFIFVIGYLGEKIQDFILENYPHIEADFVTQTKREGLGHAIWLCRDLVGEEEVFITLGDTIFEADLQPILADDHSALGLKKVDDPRDFGVAEIGDDGCIERVVEKPDIPKSNLALVGVYKIRETVELMDVLTRHIKDERRTQGEFHLTDAIQVMVAEGVRFKPFKVLNWYDCGKRDILLETNATLLKKQGFASEEVPMHENTIIVHPVAIAPGAQIANSIIGPNVAIGEGVVIKSSIIRNSIIGNNTQLDDVVLHESVVGSDSVIHGSRQSLNIGDNTEIDLR
jgi:glucose-1-phosphate thymidylyltransferase